MPIEDQMANGSRLRSVWWLAPAQFREAHFAVMPSSLAEICVIGGCPPGGTVLDPFAGAGTAGLVAARLGRKAHLIELNPEFAAMARERIERDWMGPDERKRSTAPLANDFGPLFAEPTP